MPHDEKRASVAVSNDGFTCRFQLAPQTSLAMVFGRFLARLTVFAAIAGLFTCQQAYAEGTDAVARRCGLELCGERENASLVVAIVFACAFCAS